TAGAEHRRLRSDVANLRAIAEASGGRVLDSADPTTADLFRRADTAPKVASLPLWPALLPWALAALLVDIGNRRIAWDRLVFTGGAGGGSTARARRRKAGRAEASLASRGKV